MYLEKIIKLKD